VDKRNLINSNIPEIDVIRCIATIQIVLFHMCVAEPPFANALVLWGREGVGLFFVISAAGLINRYYYQFDYKSYYKKRFISLYIPFWIAYIAIFTRNYFVNSFHFPWEINGLSPKYMLLSAFGVDCFSGVVGVPNFGLIGEWFLAVIIFIYLIFPLWRKLFIKAPEIVVLLFLVLRVIICFKNPVPQLPVCFNPITALSNFSIGAYLLYLLSKRKLSRNLMSDVIVFAISVLFIALGKYLTLKMGQADIGEIFATLGLLFILIIISPIIIKFANRFVKFVCNISYEIFLVHHVVIYATTAIVHNNFTFFNALVGYGYILSVILLFAYILKKITDPIISYISDFRFCNV
jgi:peptidoglycan/LPS O-acetylase OafA/YrhL